MSVVVSQPQAMPVVVSLLVITWMFQSTAGSCPYGYKCHLERNTYVLECDLFHKTQQLKVDDVPAIATHLKIICIHRRPSLTLTLANLPNIQKLTLDNLDLITWDDDMFRGVTNMCHLVLKKLSRKRFDNDSFSGLRNLRSLEIEHLDELKYMHPNMLTPLLSLQSLSFRHVGSVYDALNYTDYGLVIQELHHLKHLRHLDLSHNQLSTLSVSARKALDEIPTVEVDISGNPLLCDCSNTDFVTWIYTTNTKFLNKQHTQCTGKNHTMNLLFYFDHEALVVACRSSNTRWYLTILLPIGIAFIIIAVLICALYRYRWKCAYCCSRIHVYKMSSDDKVDPVVYERDAFICYSSSDRAWVCNELLKRLEDGHVSTIIHQRDFLPGSVLHDSIIESIDKCRYTILVFSPDFLASDWCKLETHLARSCIITQGRDVIVPIVLREFPNATLSPTFVGILEKSYLKWSDNPDEQPEFWDRLITKLTHGGNIRPLDM
ncbi:hypothetical protein NP493_38g04058 [Ridgeia piscesae]|uniref:TIR domain-containing protein n=1 Tax=Ridgeia piscesae TaxID=27915 RepID=A0AAD9UK17_RIDPI|nr:hypothetical protein NP493_38g04058 [Ridgeia piscesae]